MGAIHGGGCLPGLYKYEGGAVLEKEKALPTFDERRDVQMVTWNELLTYSMVVVAIVSLIITIIRNKK